MTSEEEENPRIVELLGAVTPPREEKEVSSYILPSFSSSDLTLVPFRAWVVREVNHRINASRNDIKKIIETFGRVWNAWQKHTFFKPYCTSKWKKIAPALFYVESPTISNHKWHFDDSQTEFLWRVLVKQKAISEALEAINRRQKRPASPPRGRTSRKKQRVITFDCTHCHKELTLNLISDKAICISVPESSSSSSSSEDDETITSSE